MEFLQKKQNATYNEKIIIVLPVLKWCCVFMIIIGFELYYTICYLQWDPGTWFQKFRSSVETGEQEQVHNLIVINIHYGCGTNSLFALIIAALYKLSIIYQLLEFLNFVIDNFWLSWYLEEAILSSRNTLLQDVLCRRTFSL